MIRTTAMFSAHTIHLLHLLVRSFFIALTVLVAALFFWLIHGIEIDKLDIGKYKIDGLYIKLDKKLTLKAREITLPQTKAKPSFERVDKTFDQIKNLLRFFDTIMLEKINFKNNHLTLLYADDVLYITSDQYEIAGNIERKGEKLIADVSLLYLKKSSVTLSGKLVYNLHNNTLETGGTFDAYGIKGHFRALKKGDEIIYAVNSRPFENLKPLISQFHMPKAIEAWVIRKVEAREYRLAYLKGKVKITGEKIIPDFTSLKGKALFKDVSVHFKSDLPPVKAKGMVIRYKKGNLYFDFDKPRYEGRDINGTTVVIKHIVGVQTPVLTLELKVHSQVDAVLQKILKAYGLKIPVRYEGTKSRLSILLKIPLSRNVDKKISVAVHVALGKGILHIDNYDLKVAGGEISYENRMVFLKGVRVREPWFKGKVDGTIDIVKKEANLKLIAKKISIGEQASPLIVLTERTLPMKLDYSKGVDVFFPSLNIRFMQQKKHIQLKLGDLSSIVPFLVNNVLGLKAGTLQFESSNGQLYRFSGTIMRDHAIFYGENKRCYREIPLEGTYSRRTGKVEIYAFDKRLHIDLSRGRITLDHLNIDLKHLIEEIESLTKKARKKSVLKKTFVIIGKHSHIRYETHVLVTDSYDIEISSKGDIEAYGSVDGDVVKFNKKGDYFTLQALRVKDKMLHPLINFDGLKDGRYSLKMEGVPGKKMKGRIIIEGGVLSGFKAYSNTLAFVNTLPALATLSSPGFSPKGFKITEGVIEYVMTPKSIRFTSVYLKGNSATVVGKGIVDLKTEAIDINLAILTVRELGKLVGKIPLLGYILMGDDNSMTVGLKITGKLSDPKVHTSVAKDILTLPLQILKRTLTAPAHMEGPKVPKDLPVNLPKKSKPASKKRLPRDPNLPIPSKSRSSSSEHPASPLHPSELF